MSDRLDRSGGSAAGMESTPVPSKSSASAPRARGVKRLLLDVSSLMYRAFFSLPTSMSGEDRRPVNAVHGYLDWTAQLVRARQTHDVMHAFDANWRPEPRVAIYAGYKANRPPDPDGLPEQFGLLKEVLDAVGATRAEAPGWEAEDAIGALCAADGVGTVRNEIVTGDRDLIQLVHDPDVRVLFTVRGVSQLRELDESAVKAQYGVSADRYVDFAILRGDPSDGLPGVRGVGEKTARSLVQAYPSIDAMLEDASRGAPEHRPIKGSPALRARLRDATEYVAAMRQIVPIRSDVDVELTTGDLDDERLNELADRHRLAGPVGRLRAALHATRRAQSRHGRPG